MHAWQLPFVPLRVKKKHAHGKGPVLYEWRLYKIITSVFLCVGLTGMVQLVSRARFHAELPKEVTAKGGGCGEALQAAWLGALLWLCAKGSGAGAGCCLLEKGLGVL